jgi:uncharacterized protein (TIGR03435 family)
MKAVIAIAILGASTICAQQPPAFDVASIKVNNVTGRGPGSIQYSPSSLTMRGLSLWFIVRWAYGLENFQISGPDSMQSPPFYDIVAKSSSPVPENELRLMLRALLAERFHMAVHLDKKEMPVTALLVARSGPKFHESNGTYDPGCGPEMPTQLLGYGDDVHAQGYRDSEGRRRECYTNISMPLFATVLALMVGRTPLEQVPVVDMTGLPGRYDLATVRLPQSNDGDGPPTSSDILAEFKAILETQLGLTLERRKAMVDVLIIDHADKTPTEN